MEEPVVCHGACLTKLETAGSKRCDPARSGVQSVLHVSLHGRGSAANPGTKPVQKEPELRRTHQHRLRATAAVSGPFGSPPQANRTVSPSNPANLQWPPVCSPVQRFRPKMYERDNRTSPNDRYQNQQKSAHRNLNLYILFQERETIVFPRISTRIYKTVRWTLQFSRIEFSSARGGAAVQ